MIKKVFSDGAALSAYVSDQIGVLLGEKPDALLCIAAGHSSLGVFQELLRRVEAGAISFKQARFVAMDEWTGMNIADPGSMSDFLTGNFLNRAGFAEVMLFDGMADPEQECRKIESYITGCGGIDYVLFGLGLSGHVALNEPGVRPDSRCHVASLHPLTMESAKKYFPKEDGPVSLIGGVTIGMANAMEAKKVVLAVNSAQKKEVVARLLALPPTSELPATYLKSKEGFELLLTEEACPA